MNTARISLVIAALFALTSLASAYTLTYSKPIPVTNVGAALQTIQLDQFDPSKGTLLSIELTLEATTSSGSIAWDNEGGVHTDVDLGIGTEVTATAPDALAIVVTPMQLGDATVDPDNELNDGAADFAGTDCLTVNSGSGADDDTAYLTDPPDDFTPYVGTGTFGVDIESVLKIMLITSGSTGETQQSSGVFDGTVKVTYTYIPEPITLSLLGFGALGLLRRRRR